MEMHAIKRILGLCIPLICCQSKQTHAFRNIEVFLVVQIGYSQVELGNWISILCRQSK